MEWGLQHGVELAQQGAVEQPDVGGIDGVTTEDPVGVAATEGFGESRSLRAVRLPGAICVYSCPRSVWR